MTKSELDILTEAFSTQRLSKYVAYNHEAFPNLPKKDRQRKNVSAPCNTLRRLRNRIFHQEAICWDLYYLTCLHDNLVTVLGWMNEDMPKWLAPIDPFDDVCAAIRKEMGWR